MADFSTSITIADEDVPAFVDALNWAWGEKDNGDGTTTPKTFEELKTEHSNRVKNALDDVTARYDKHLYALAYPGPDPAIQIS